MTSQQIRDKFLNFFKDKKHVIVPSSSLLSDDPSVLLTTAGVQQFKSYYTGARDPQADFNSRRVISIQKSFRTTDIDEVGDEIHNTFFEMLGNFSFGDYYKKEALRWAYEFITDELGVDPKRITATVFEGNQIVPKDDESYKIWLEDIGLPKNKIKFALWDNFWGPTGQQGPCGPTSEIYIDGVEVWNIVFNEYLYRGSREELIAGAASLEKLTQPGIDTGMGLERLVKSLQQTPTIFETDIFQPLMELIPETFSVSEKRILADHARGIAFLIADGVRPSNKEAGYILRRLIRRAATICHSRVSLPAGKHGGNPPSPIPPVTPRSSLVTPHSPLVIPNSPLVIPHSMRNPDPKLFSELLSQVVAINQSNYPELKVDVINKVYKEEVAKFEKTLEKGLRELAKIEVIDASTAFKLFETYGLPYEVIKDAAGAKAEKLTATAFNKEFAKHQEISRAGQEKKFGGHGLLLDTGELKAGDTEELASVTRLHTATHLLQQALRDILGATVQQKGSDITIKRTRFDFSFSRKITPEELKKVEQIVNDKIKENLPVNFVELPLEDAKKTGALHFFNQKYPDRVKVYYVGKSLEQSYSKEFCGGPHVSHTAEIGKFKIQKEEGIGSGLRRIRAVLT